ncbi:glycoside hydrolase superfamily [Bisporella sp. PMI_857]|nr:glycoside hydrolase superfamily [Bisporella sp. PMI_857]
MVFNTDSNAQDYRHIKSVDNGVKSNLGPSRTQNDGAKTFAARILAQLTLEEKVQLLAGSDLWRTEAIPRVGVSKMKFSDGPVGVRGGLFADGVSAASLPTGQMFGAVCIPRTPLGGRNFEAYSEDPFLSGKLAATYINTIQSAGIGACIKHFAANDQETRRFFVDAIIPERALREIHLQPFEIAIRESNPWTLMTAYNKVNGTFSSANAILLKDILREEWGWDGLVMSDWFGTNTIVPSIKAGMDLEMPGPVRRRGKYLIEAYRNGFVDESDIERCAIRVLELLHKTGKSVEPDWKEPKEQAIDLPEHRTILRRSAAEGIVLLKNETTSLPLKLRENMRVAIIGPNAGRAIQSGGGSSNLVPHYRTTPFDSIKMALDSYGLKIDVQHAAGMRMHRYIPLIDPTIMRDPVTGESGFTMSYWTNMQHSGTPLYIENRRSSFLVCYDALPAELMNGKRYSYRARTTLTPKTTGMHTLSLSTCGPAKLMLDGKILLDIDRHWDSPKSALFMSYGSPEERIDIPMEAGRSYELQLESISRESQPYDITPNGDLPREEVKDGGRIGFIEEVKEDLFGAAVDLARNSDVVIMVFGKDAEWESETSDQPSYALPGVSNELISAILDVKPDSILVNQTGSPIAMPWIDRLSTFVQAWYQGQEHANALADVLLGTVNPCGKLPITFPRRYEDNPSYLNYPGGNDTVVYGEGIFAGYRYYDWLKIEPQFPFGFGLSYTSFEFSNIRLSTTKLDLARDPSASIEIEVDVVNVGHVAGKEVVQFYVTQISTQGLVRPVRELKGWEKVFVEPGQRVTARTTLDWVSVAYWDDKPHKWVVDGNAAFEVLAARHSRDMGVVAEFCTAERYVRG